MIAFVAINPLAALATLAYFALVAWVMQALIGNRMKRASEQVNEGTISANASIGDLSEAIKEATVLGKKDFFLDRIHESRVKAASNYATQFVLNGMPRYIVETALILAISLFVLYQAVQGDLVAASGTLGVFLSGGLRLTASLLPLQSALLSIRSAMPPAEKALELLERVTSEQSLAPAPETVSSAQSQPARVEITNLIFTYPNSPQPTIKNLNLTIEPGQQVAFIGESGAGKSTIADLILGLLMAQSGEVSINGTTPAAMGAAQPGYLGYVPQKPGLISGTIEANIALGVPRAEIDAYRLADAIRNAHLTQVISSLPEGVQTDIGKRKDGLSGGQLQRIGLARALYSKPGLLILDEATSALDADSEDEIKRSLEEIRGSVTTILITHRLNTIERSDFAVLIQDGQSVASGSFAELAQQHKSIRTFLSKKSAG
jgi:ATP-binding cassette subfamily C protein